MMDQSPSYGRNVVRFPVELRARPSLGLLSEIAPDVRSLSLLAEAYEIEMPCYGAEDEADVAAAAHIAAHVPRHDQKRGALLDELAHAPVAAAVEACRHAHAKAAALAKAEAALAEARASTGYWLGPLEARVETLHAEMAEAFVAAHGRAREAQGITRAIDLARRWETWSPRDYQADTMWLIEAERTARRHAAG